MLNLFFKYRIISKSICGGVLGITAGFAICEDQGKNLYPGDQDHMSHIKIPVSTLRPGMYIVDPGISWLKAPLLYM